MNAHGVFNLPGVASGQRSRHRNAPAAGFLKYPAVALLQSFLCQRQSAQLIFAEWVRAPHVKQKLGAKVIERLLHSRQQCAEIFKVVGAIHQMEIVNTEESPRKMAAVPLP